MEKGLNNAPLTVCLVSDMVFTSVTFLPNWTSKVENFKFTFAALDYGIEVQSPWEFTSALSLVAVGTSAAVFFVSI
jgi:hypothetical protein